MKLANAVMAGVFILLTERAGAAGESKSFRLDETTISDVQAAYKSGATTATRVVQGYLDRIHAYDQAGPKLHVVIFLNPKALEEAAALDENFRKTGHRRPPATTPSLPGGVLN
jgi:amidase